ncbi:hypothetical protein HPB52_005406 [Rhipicephalus sanguineus]|uniref:CCHC-type domain-containing protein n=1 Tax=Rhipicephalus sanguineus TaxID=34632 RepID=A0A9D4Q934_RHISA|nr:hypothetical protein HPB52_005406 [Rhipicephalus sanguineus]
MAAHVNAPVRENCFFFNAPEGDVSIDDLIDAVELTAGEDSVMVLQHMGGSKFLVCTRTASQATKLMVDEGFLLKGARVAVEAVGPPITFVNVFRYPAYLPDDPLTNALSQYGKIKSVALATMPNRQNKLNGVRVVRMEMAKPVPNFTNIAGHRVMFEYRGMKRVCARCGEVGHMASACTVPYCKRCGTFGHETEGCEEVCKRCGGHHGTRDCFRRRSYASAARGVSSAQEPGTDSDLAGGSASTRASTSALRLQVLTSRPKPLAHKRPPPNYWDGETEAERTGESAEASTSASHAEERISEDVTHTLTSDSDTSDLETVSEHTAPAASPGPLPSTEDQPPATKCDGSI